MNRREDTEAEVRETLADGRRRFAEAGGVWFTGLPRAGRWRDILGRFAIVREHDDDPMRILACDERDGRIAGLCVAIWDRRADRLLVVRQVGAPFAVKAID